MGADKNLGHAESFGHYCPKDLRSVLAAGLEISYDNDYLWYRLNGLYI